MTPDELRERVAVAIAQADPGGGAWTDIIDSTRDDYRTMADAAILIMQGEWAIADLTVRAAALVLRDAREQGRDVRTDDLDEAIHEPFRVVMKR